MNLKSLLLGSAAALSVVGGAQAADLTVAEPVDYVKVCDAFGKGYWYAPGTDTCLKIGGWVRFQVQFDDALNDDPDGERDYDFRTRTSLTVTASSMTEYGPLTAFMDYRMESYESQDSVSKLDTGWLQLGPIQAGKFASSFEFGGGYDDDGGYRSDEKTDHIALTYALNGFGIILAVEDPQDRTEENTGALLAGPLTGDEEEFPDLVAALTYSQGIVNAKLAGAYVDSSESGDSAWAVGAGVELSLDSFSKGDKFKLMAAYSQNAPSFVGATNVSGSLTDKIGGNEDGEAWNVLASYKHVWNAQWYSALTGSYVSFEDDAALSSQGDLDAWKVTFDTAFSPVENFLILGEVGYYENDGRGDADSFYGFARVQRAFP